MNIHLISRGNLSRFLLIILLFSSPCFLGCSSVPLRNPTVVSSYEAAGETLNISQPILKAMCKRGALSAEACADAKKAYNNAVGIYKLLGTTAIIAIDTGDQAAYALMQAELAELITQEVSAMIPLAGQLLSLGLSVADLIDIAEIDVSEDDREAMKAAIANARNGVSYWKNKDGN